MNFGHFPFKIDLISFSLSSISFPNTFTFSCAIRNDTENMTICFVGENNRARSLRKARNSRNTQSEKQIIGIFELYNNKWDKCIYIRNRRDIVDNFNHDIFSDELKRYLHID